MKEIETLLNKTYYKDNEMFKSINDIQIILDYIGMLLFLH